MSETAPKLTRADLENAGYTIIEGGEEEIPAKNLSDQLNLFYEELPQPEKPARKSRKKPQDREISLLLTVLSTALRILALRVLLFATGGVSAALFFFAIREPSLPKIAVPVAFTVLVFLPTLYYSSKIK